jgi:hypothetical protein
MGFEIEADLEARLKAHFLDDFIPKLYKNGYRTSATVVEHHKNLNIRNFEKKEEKKAALIHQFLLLLHLHLEGDGSLLAKHWLLLHSNSRSSFLPSLSNLSWSELR